MMYLPSEFHHAVLWVSQRIPKDGSMVYRFASYMEIKTRGAQVK